METRDPTTKINVKVDNLSAQSAAHPTLRTLLLVKYVLACLCELVIALSISEEQAATVELRTSIIRKHTMLTSKFVSNSTSLV
jgi:hypothetical protein